MNTQELHPSIEDAGAPESRPVEPRLESGRVRWLVVIAGLLAGLLAFAVGEVAHGLIPAERIEANLMGNRVMVPDREASAVADAQNGAVAFGVLGLCLGAALGIVGGLARRSALGSVTGALVGSILSAGLGAGLSLALLTRFIAAKYSYFDYDLPISAAMHGTIWGLLGAAGGLAFAVGLGDWRRCAHDAFAGLIGALMGSLAYEIIGAVLLPAADTDEVISETWPTRLMARVLVAVGAAVAVALSLSGPSRSEPAVTHSDETVTTPPAQA